MLSSRVYSSLNTSSFKSKKKKCARLSYLQSLLVQCILITIYLIFTGRRIKIYCSRVAGLTVLYCRKSQGREMNILFWRQKYPSTKGSSSPDFSPGFSPEPYISNVFLLSCPVQPYIWSHIKNCNKKRKIQELYTHTVYLSWSPIRRVKQSPT